MSSIYRKYRPKSFSEMVGQNHIKLTLQNELEADSIVHAYLFCGPRGLGKTTAARLFAKAVNCVERKNGQSEPCNKCKLCAEINESRSLDLVEIDAASHTGVDNVRENIIENVRFSPVKAKFKVFIIDEVHMMSISAFNALLKTLEEPPPYVIFILCTTEIHKVPETIISRCQRFDFKKLATGEIIKRLKRISEQEKVKIETEIFEIIALKSDGYMRDAESLLGQVLSLGGKNITKSQVSLILPASDISLIVEFVNLLIAEKASEGLEFVNKLVEEGVDLEIFTKEVIEFLRKLMLIKSDVVKGEWFKFSTETQKEVERILEYTNLTKLTEIIKIFLQVNIELKNSSIIQLPLELAVIRICGEAGSGNPGNPVNQESKKTYAPSGAKQENKPVTGGHGNLNAKTNPPKADKAPLAQKQENKSNDNNSNIDIEKIKKNWVKILHAGHKKSRDLMFMDQKMVWPIGVKGRILEVGFQYDLHKNRFESNSNQEIFAEAVREVSGEDVKIQTKILKPSELAELEIAEEAKESENEELSGVKVTDGNILNQVLESFGGEVVDDK